jgi:hypothetical protein
MEPSSSITRSPYQRMKYVKKSRRDVLQ